MRARRPASDEGAMLILVLVIVTILGIAAAAIAQLGYSTPQAQRAFAGQERITNALDAATAGAMEDVRLAHAVACQPDLQVPNADGLAGTAAYASIKVVVGCAKATADGSALPTNQLRFIATAYMPQPKDCVDAAPRLVGKALETTVAFFVATSPSPTTARVVSREVTALRAPAATCDPDPHP